MDIIASHQLGLIEQYSEEAAGLAGRERDTVQRAVVYHHLYQHSGGRHGYALLAAEAAVTLDPLLIAVERAARRGWWRIGRRRAEALAERARTFAATVRTIDRERCEALLMAYRLALTPGLAGHAAERLPAELVAALRGEDRRMLFLAHQRWAEQRWGLAIEAAIEALGWPLGAARVAAAIAALRLPLDRFEAADKRGWAATEARLLARKGLPRGFAINPGQHYYKLQRGLADQRRRAPASDPAPDEAVRLAA